MTKKGIETPSRLLVECVRGKKNVQKMPVAENGVQIIRFSIFARPDRSESTACAI